MPVDAHRRRRRRDLEPPAVGPTTTCSRSQRPRSPPPREPGQFVMVKPRRGARSAAAAAVLDLRNPARRRRHADGHLAAQQAHRRRHALLYDARAGRRLRLPRAARPAVRAGGIRQRKPGWSPAASASRRSPRSPKRSRRAARRRRCSTARDRAAELFSRRLVRALGVEPVLATEDGSRGAQGPHHRAARAGARRRARSRRPVQLSTPAARRR